MTPMLAVAQMFPEGKAAMEEHAALNEYFKRQAARPSFAATIPTG